MFKSRRALLPLLVVPALLAFTPRSAEIAYAPTKGLAVKKTITSSAEMAMDEMNLVVDGQEMDQGGDMEMEMSEEQTLVILDTYVDPGTEQPLMLTRSFESIADSSSRSMSHPMMGDNESTASGESDLEGRIVKFTWDAEEGGYQIAFADDGDADDSLLQGLEEDIDLRGFLPDGEVAEGDTWDVDPEMVRNMLAPGGNLKIVEESEGEADMFGGGPEPSMAEMLGDMTGKVSCTFLGMREEGETQVAAIKVVVEISSTNDLAEFLSEQLANQEKPEGMDFEMDIESMDVEFQFEGEGEMLWDVKNGVLRAFNLEGDVTMTNDTAMSMAFMGQEQTIEQSMVIAGTSKLNMMYEVQ